MINEEFVGNLTTIMKILILTFVPAAFLETVDANVLATVLTAIIMFVFSFIDAKYSNTFAIFSENTNNGNDIDVSEEGV